MIIIKERIENKIEQYVIEDQFSFRSGRGTVEAVLALRMIVELEENRSFY